MGKKKLKLPFLVKNTSSSSSSWPWPSCHQPRTLSFRATNDIFKTINSAYLDLDATMELLENSESFFTVSPDSASFCSASEENSRTGDPVETVIRGSVQSDRLFFEPDETSSILDSKLGTSSLAFKDSVVLSMDSQDPYVDFLSSMEEMAEAHGLKDWNGLEDLLCCYLRLNGNSNHGYIVGAFVDLLLRLALASSNSAEASSSSSNSHSSSSPLSFHSSSSSSSCSVSTPSSSLLLEQVKEEIQHQDEAHSNA